MNERFTSQFGQRMAWGVGNGQQFGGQQFNWRMGQRFGGNQNLPRPGSRPPRLNQNLVFPVDQIRQRMNTFQGHHAPQLHNQGGQFQHAPVRNFSKFQAPFNAPGQQNWSNVRPQSYPPFQGQRPRFQGHELQAQQQLVRGCLPQFPAQQPLIQQQHAQHHQQPPRFQQQQAQHQQQPFHFQQQQAQRQQQPSQFQQHPAKNQQKQIKLQPSQTKQPSQIQQQPSKLQQHPPQPKKQPSQFHQQQPKQPQLRGRTEIPQGRIQTHWSPQRKRSPRGNRAPISDTSVLVLTGNKSGPKVARNLQFQTTNNVVIQLSPKLASEAKHGAVGKTGAPPDVGSQETVKVKKEATSSVTMVTANKNVTAVAQEREESCGDSRRVVKTEVKVEVANEQSLVQSTSVKSEPQSSREKAEDKKPATDMTTLVQGISEVTIRNGRGAPMEVVEDRTKRSEKRFSCIENHGNSIDDKENAQNSVRLVTSQEKESLTKNDKMEEDKPAEMPTTSGVLSTVLESFSEEWNTDVLEEEEEEEDEDLLAEPLHLRKSATLDATPLAQPPSVSEPQPSTSDEPAYELRERPPSREKPTEEWSSSRSRSEDDESYVEVTTLSDGKRKKHDWGNYKIAKRKNYSLDILLHERKKTEQINKELKEMSKELQEDIKAGGIDKLNLEKIEVSVEELIPEYRQHLTKMDIQEETIKDNHSGETVFRQGSYKCLFSYPDTLTPANCGVSGSSYMDQHLITLPPDMLLEFISGEVLVLCYKKITKGHELLDWLFYLMSIHPKSLVGLKCHHTLSELLFLGTGTAATWWPGPKHLATVLINYGADLQSIPRSCMDKSFTEENLRFPDDKENSNEFNQPVIMREEDSSYRQENFHNVLYILTESCTKRKDLVKDEDVVSLIMMLFKVSLDKTLIISTIRHDIMVCIAALLEAASTDGWKDVVLKLSENVPMLTSHHHNRLSLVQLLPPSGRCEHFRRRLAYAVLQKVLHDTFIKEEIANLKVHHLIPIMDHLSLMGTSRNIDYYLMSSVIRLADLAVGNETLPSSERDDLNRLTEKMRSLISDVKDMVNIMDRTVVKDLMHRILSKWTFMAQNMGKKQGTIFAWATQGSQNLNKIVPVSCSQGDGDKLDIEET